MAKKIAFMTIHGMGATEDDYYEELRKDIADRLGPSDWSQVHFGDVFYQDLLEPNQSRYFKAVKGKIDQKKLRNFMLSGFSDAGGLEYARTRAGSAYELSQKRIFTALGKAYRALGNQAGPVVFIAQSLGCQVLSNYIWDAQHHANRPHGIWRHDHASLAPADLKFRKLSSLRVLMTTGCNIPIFVGGLPYNRIKPFKRPNNRFVWENYFDEDDVLGWPMQPLSAGHNALVRDIEVNAGGFFTSWNPFSHTQYWTDKDVTEPLAKHLKALL
jgi:hypothetical protein